MNRTITLAILLASFAVPCLAQIENPNIDLFGSYSHVGNYGIGLHGWTGAATWHLYRWLGLEGDLSGDYGRISLGQAATVLPNVPHSIGSTIYSFDVGPVGTYHPEDANYDAFGHLLFGFSHTNVNAANAGQGDTSFSWILGGGADYNFTSSWAGRAQLDLLRTDFFSRGQNHGRISIGLVYRLR